MTSSLPVPVLILTFRKGKTVLMLGVERDSALTGSFISVVIFFLGCGGGFVEDFVFVYKVLGKERS